MHSETSFSTLNFLPTAGFLMVVQPSKHEFECLTGNFADDASQLEAGWSTFRTSSSVRGMEMCLDRRDSILIFESDSVAECRWTGREKNRTGPSLIHSFLFRRCSHAEPPRFTLPPIISPITKPAANFYNRLSFPPPIFHARSIESVDRPAPIPTEFKLKINREYQIDANAIIHSFFAWKYTSIVLIIF